MVESSSDEILAGADTTDVVFLVVGDPFGYVDLEIKAFLLGLCLPYTEPPRILILSSVPESSTSQRGTSQMPQSCLL